MEVALVMNGSLAAGQKCLKFAGEYQPDNSPRGKVHTVEQEYPPIVSFDEEPLILVDSIDNIVGYRSKRDCHQNPGILHRAFSVFVFNCQNELLVQQRSSQKPLWPLYWSNSCCSHPRRGEQGRDSVKRRLREELSVECEPEFLYKFCYRAEYDDVGAEHELCSVYIARWDGPVTVNDNEVAGWLYVSAEIMERELAENSQAYTPWLKLEWPRIRNEFWARVESLN